jgi:hypothetical protein
MSDPEMERIFQRMADRAMEKRLSRPKPLQMPVDPRGQSRSRYIRAKAVELLDSPRWWSVYVLSEAIGCHVDPIYRFVKGRQNVEIKVIRYQDGSHSRKRSEYRLKDRDGLRG